MSSVDTNSQAFLLPRLRVDRLETAMLEPRYVVTLEDRGKRFMIAPKLADLIMQLQQGKSLREAAEALSVLWREEVSAEGLREVIARQMVPKGLAQYKSESAPPAPEAGRGGGIYQKVLHGQFYWQLLNRRVVGKVCSPLRSLFDPFSVALALVLIVASRWSLYGSIDWHFYKQMVTQFTPNEYLLSLALLVVVVLIHELGHAAAQMRYGLRVGGIGFQLYHYIPALFANVDGSWSLSPRRRAVVDAGGIYFQSVVASLLYLLYLNTGEMTLLAVVVVSDTLCLFTLNPFLKFDGYWLLADALALPNMQKLSDRFLKFHLRRLFGRGVRGAGLPDIGRGREIGVTVYALLRRAFALLLASLIVFNAADIYSKASATLSGFAAQCWRGLSSADAALTASGLIRLTLFVLLLLTISSLLGSVLLKIWQEARGWAGRLFGPRGHTLGDAAPQG
jgi:putative peptide zinc metalloprotease protein